MPKIRFTADPKSSSEAVRTHGYKRGVVVDLPESSCWHWINRNCAVFVQDEPVAVTEAPPPPANATSFDPTTAPLDEVRDYLRQHNVTPGPRVSEAKMRETALEILTRA